MMWTTILTAPFLRAHYGHGDVLRPLPLELAHARCLAPLVLLRRLLDLALDTVSLNDGMTVSVLDFTVISVHHELVPLDQVSGRCA